MGKQEAGCVVGIDEAGRGPLAGMVVASALHLKYEPPFPLLDSKLLSPQKRDEAFDWLIKNAVFGIGQASAEEIDTHNILAATLLAFNRAVDGLLEKDKSLDRALFIVDGQFFNNILGLNVRCQVKADRTVPEVSAASIVAKVVRDHLMQGIDFLYPEWEFHRHKGYPTALHREKLAQHEITPFHRKSFAPCLKSSR